MAKNKGDGCQFWDVKCHLKNVPVLGGLSKALDKPWQAASGVVAESMKGTPLEGVSSALSLGSRGKITEAVHAGVHGVLDLVKSVVPGLASVPFIGVGVDALSNQAELIIAKNTGGTAAAPNGAPLPDLGMVLGGAVGSALGIELQRLTGNVPNPSVPVRRAEPAPPAGAAAVVMNAASVVQPPASMGGPQSAPMPGVKRKLRVFTPVEWAAFASDPRTAGGTQAWSVP